MTLTQQSFTSYDAAFADVLGHDAHLLHVLDIDAHEGPVYAADEDALYFTSVPPARVKRLALDGMRFPLEPERVSVVPASVNLPNGMTMGIDGELVVCEQGTRAEPARLSRIHRRTGETGTIVECWRGLALNSPNDVVVRRDGTIWFTDPSYGFLQGFRPEPQVGDFVYRFDPGSLSLAVVADSLCKPNGIAFSPDESVLYLTDSGANQEAGTYFVGLPHHVVAFDVHSGRHLTNHRLIAVTTPGFPDGIKVDAAGRIYVSSFSGVQVLSPEGDLLGQINVPGAVNFTFGGADNNVLFITTDTAVMAAVLDTRGA